MLFGEGVAKGSFDERESRPLSGMEIVFLLVNAVHFMCVGCGYHID